MLEGIMNSADAAMGQPQAPQPVQAAAPVAQPGGQDQGAPSPSMSFDVQKNPQDMQMMTDAMMFAPMLKQMSPDERKQKWPDMVNSLSQVSPKASQLFDPTLPPSNKDLDVLLNKMKPQDAAQAAPGSDDFNKAQVQRQLQGLPAQTADDYARDKMSQANPQAALSNMSDYEFLHMAAKAAGTLASQVGSGLSKAADAAGNAIFPTANAAGYDSPATMEDPRLKNAPGGRMWVDPNNPDAGTTAIKGGDKDKPYDVSDPKVTAMLNVCKDQLSNIQNLLFDGQGGVKQSTITGMSLHQPGRIPGVGEIHGLTNEDAASAGKSFQACLQGIARAQNPGRPPNEKVMSAVADVYQPKSTDSTDEVYQKYFMMKNMVNGYLSQLNPGMDGDPKAAAVKAQASMSSMQSELYSNKKSWVADVLAMPENQGKGLTADDVGKAYNQKMLTDPDFVRQLKAHRDANPKTPKNEMM